MYFSCAVSILKCQRLINVSKVSFRSHFKTVLLADLKNLFSVYFNILEGPTTSSPRAGIMRHFTTISN